MKKIVRLRNSDICCLEACKNKAVAIVFDRSNEDVKAYCEDHYLVAAHSSKPEYVNTCPNCRCYIPVN